MFRVANDTTEAAHGVASMTFGDIAAHKGVH